MTMTVAVRQGTRDTGVSGYPPALRSTRAPQPDGPLPWPQRPRCDLIDAPLDACCGVVAHLARNGARVCPVAQVADRLLFLVAEGSTAPCGAEAEGLPAGLLLSRTRVAPTPGAAGGAS